MTVGGKTVPAVVKFTIKASYNGKVEDTIEGIVKWKILVELGLLRLQRLFLYLISL